ncbi:hypothetical protein ColLi_01204 [Colletotrichum liriopes]|uniref:Uncharacterized protein n=1 Tax=Colletotrichum liriopes TaxID=708192 RepID=A0AA37GDB7_9PEZI|nr:hypothetical protein ColLi_01204 [Colletotrichum liriopes]
MMRGLAQALLLAPALHPPGFNEDQPKPYTLHLEVLEAPSPCAYPNVKVNDNPLSQGGHTLGRGTFAGDHDGTTFIASWSATCAGDEQLLRFTLESLAGRTLAADLAFVARFRQTAPAAVIEVAGNVQVSDQRPPPASPSLPEFDRHSPRPGDDEDGLLEDPPFPPPPHHHVGNHPDNHPGDRHDEEHRHRPGRPASPEEDEHVLAELRELDCLRHQLHALKHAIHDKESRLAREHGIVLHHGRRRAFKECDSLKCIIETFMHRVGGGFRGQGGGRHGGPGRGHHGPPDSCPGFPFPEHGNHGKGNHTLPPPPPPEGPPGGPPEGPPGRPRALTTAITRALLPRRPPTSLIVDLLGTTAHPRLRPTSRSTALPTAPMGLPTAALPASLPRDPLRISSTSTPLTPTARNTAARTPTIAVATLLLVGVLALLHAGISRASSRRESRRERKHSRRARHRRDYREARNAAFKASLADLWPRMFAGRVPADAEDEEKRAFLSGAHSRPSTSSDEGDFETMDSMTSEITDPTAAFAEYMGDDVLPAYDEHASSVVVSDGFSSYSPGSTEYVPGASSDTASNIDSVLGDPKN